jgi:protein phosphatase 1 regulatory subunit 37
MFFLGSVALAEVIADSPKLVRVDLRENEIKTAGMMALALALKVNVILQRLDLTFHRCFPPNIGSF